MPANYLTPRTLATSAIGLIALAILLFLPAGIEAAPVRAEALRATIADTNALLTGLQARGTVLASLGPVVGLAQLARGEIDRETYARQWGHRSPHEFEVSTPRPAEDPAWIDRQLAGLEGVQDALALMERQEHVRAEAWERARHRYPSRADALSRRVSRAAAAFAAREATRPYPAGNGQRNDLNAARISSEDCGLAPTQEVAAFVEPCCKG